MPTERQKENNNIKEYLIGLNELGLPKVYDMSKIEPGKLNSAIILITKLILMRKGTIADIPDMGVDIRGRYRFSFEEELTMLQADIQAQIEAYLPEFIPVNVAAYFERDRNGYPGVAIVIIINKTAYRVLYSIEKNTIEGITSGFEG